MKQNNKYLKEGKKRLKKAEKSIDKKFCKNKDDESLSDIDPDKILKDAEGKLGSVIVIGYDKKGLLYIKSSKKDISQVIWLLEKARKQIFDIDEKRINDEKEKQEKERQEMRQKYLEEKKKMEQNSSVKIEEKKPLRSKLNSLKSSLKSIFKSKA